MAPPSKSGDNIDHSESTKASSSDSTSFHQPLFNPPLAESSNAATLSSQSPSFKRTVTITSSGSTSFHHSLFNPPLVESSNAATSSKAPSFKRTFEHDSTPASLPSSPPHKKSAPVFQSPDREHLREALQSGGTADLDVQQGKFIQH
jgi:hypothetical protein